MKPQVLPAWLFDGAMSEARGEAADAMYTALSEGNKAAYVTALQAWQTASGGLKGCPGALVNCPWNPADTVPAAASITRDSEGYLCLGGQRLPLA